MIFLCLQRLARSAIQFLLGRTRMFLAGSLGGATAIVVLDIQVLARGAIERLNRGAGSCLAVAHVAAALVSLVDQHLTGGAGEVGASWAHILLTGILYGTTAIIFLNHQLLAIGTERGFYRGTTVVLTEHLVATALVGGIDQSLTIITIGLFPLYAGVAQFHSLRYATTSIPRYIEIMTGKGPRYRKPARLYNIDRGVGI